MPGKLRIQRKVGSLIEWLLFAVLIAESDIFYRLRSDVQILNANR